MKRLLEAIDSVPTVAVVTVFAAAVLVMNVGSIIVASDALLLRPYRNKALRRGLNARFHAPV